MSRIEALKNYVIGVLEDILTDDTFKMNVDFLSNEINSYSIDKIPTSSVIEKWLNDEEVHKEVYLIRSRFFYGEDESNNLSNIGFYETLEETIRRKNDRGELPNIEGIEEITCLNCGSINNVETNTAEFNMQIQITYRINNNTNIVSI